MEAETTGQASYEGIEKMPVGDPFVSNDGTTAVPGEIFIDKVSACKMCKENLYGRQPRFLNCLHSLCIQCINSLDVSDGHYIKCPECSVVTHLGSLIDNLFEIKPQPILSNGGGNSHEDKTKFCMGCDDNVPALFFCVECSEWLCDQCTQAHRRVKITKDHTIEPKEIALTRSEDSSHHPDGRVIHQAFFCQVHPQEQLKLYCCTCHKMTCRDCQLLEHKDHKYQFLQEAATSYRDVLASLLLKIKEKQLYIDNAKNLIERRNKEISQKETCVINEVKAFALALISDINNKCRQLISDLQSICLAKKRQLLQKDAEISCLFENLEYCLLFGEHLLSSGDDMQLLYAYHLVANRLKSILKTRCEVPNPHHVVDLRFSQNAAVTTAMGKLGCIVVDGVPFNRNQSPSTAPEVIINSNALPQMNVPGVFNNGNNQGLPLPQQPQQIQQPLNSPVSISDQKLMNQWLKRQSEERRHHHLQRNQQHQLQQQQQQQLQQQQLQHQMLSLFAGYSTNNNNNNLIPSDNRHSCLMPNQSANISSSNMSKRQSRAVSGTFYPPQLQQQPMLQQQASSNSYIYPPAYPHLQTLHPHHSQSSQQLISLSLLQEDRIRRIKQQQQQHQQQQQQQQQMIMSSTRPIVVEPTNPEQITSPNALQGMPNSLHDLTKLIQGQMTPCSSSDQNRSEIQKYLNEQAMFPAIIKQENHKSGSSNDATTTMLSSRSPTPRIESTTFEHNNFDSNNIFESTFDNWSSSDDVTPTTNNNSNISNDVASKILTTPDNTVSMQNQNEMTIDSDITADKNTSMSSEEASSILSPMLRVGADPSDDYCAVCSNGGELLCCDGCPKVFHMQCHVSQLAIAPNDKWFCGSCTSDDVLRLDALDEETSSRKRHHKIDLTAKERLVCERLLLELYCDCLSTPFQEPVSRMVPNYYKIITRPMDFQTIRIKLIKKHFDKYQDVENFIRDILLVFSNCASFNPESSDVAQAGQALETKFRKRCSDLLPYINLDTLAPDGDQTSSLLQGPKKIKISSNVFPLPGAPAGSKLYMSAGEEEIAADGGRNTASSI